MGGKKITVSQILGAINRVAPPELAENWDNVGLQIGDPNREVNKVLVSLEISQQVIDEALEKKADTIVTHHPLIFGGVKSINEAHTSGSFITQLIRANISVLTAHTNLDSVPNGTNGEIADRLKLAKRKVLFPNGIASQEVKYVVFVPTSHAEAVIEAIHQACAGVIGDYSHCTFRSPGTGTYKPLEGANPYEGKVGELEQAEDEVRLETVCPKKNLGKLIEKVNKAHPYEEVAYDVYPLEQTKGTEHGLGLIGKLEKPVTLDDFAKLCQEKFPAQHIGVVGKKDQTIKRVAVCSGAGGEAVRRWRDGQADLLITGEMTHHHAADLRDRGCAAILLGHFESEAIVCERFAKLIQEQIGTETIELMISEKEESPIWRI